MYKYGCIIQFTASPKWWGTFLLLENSFLFFFVATRLCLHLRYWLIFKDPIESRQRVPSRWVELYSSCPLYSFTLIQPLNVWTTKNNWTVVFFYNLDTCPNQNNCGKPLLHIFSTICSPRSTIACIVWSYDNDQSSLYGLSQNRAKYKWYLWYQVF